MEECEAKGKGWKASFIYRSAGGKTVFEQLFVNDASRARELTGQLSMSLFVRDRIDPFTAVPFLSYTCT